MTSSILEVFGFSHLKTSPSWGEVPFLCPKILTAQGLRLLQNAHLYFENRIGSFQLSERAKNFEVEIRYLNLGEGKDTGAAAITLAVIAYDLALLKLALKVDTPHPRLLVHDSPNINDIDPAVYNRIFTYVKDTLEKSFTDEGLEPEFQYIITTILMPEELATDPYIRLELNNNGDEGKLFEFTF
ncbi:DUF2326 domain-containing protein [Paenibacillus sp. MB22_1]|uniref:DUF2326 domain-containing protein n=1 Tax=Paenibacillus sp. MB22_1 TaxID=3383121 RepID=UPI0039A2FB74